MVGTQEGAVGTVAQLSCEERVLPREGDTFYSVLCTGELRGETSHSGLEAKPADPRQGKTVVPRKRGQKPHVEFPPLLMEENLGRHLVQALLSWDSG